MRGRSYSPSPPRGYGRRGRSPSPRGRYGSRSKDKDLPTSLLVRNLRHECRAEDLRRPFGQFGPLKDIYLPRDYYSGEPRGFGFIQFVDPADAQEAKYQMDGQILLGRQLTVVFAEENRKKPTDMRSREPRGGRFSDRRRSPLRYSRSRSPAPRYARLRSPAPRYARSRSPAPRYARSRSPAPRYARSRSHGRDYSPPPKRSQHSRSVSPEEKRYSRERSYSRSPVREHSPHYNGSKSRSPVRSTSQSPPRGRSPVRGGSPSRSRSRSPASER